MADLEDILKKLGWTDGFQVPIANAENKALEEELAKLALRKSKSKNKLDRVSERLQSLRDHFKYVSQENEQNQKLITAHRQQFEREENQFHITKGEKDSVDHEIKEIYKQLRDADDRHTMKKNDLQRIILKAETLKSEAVWDSEALKAWEESLKRKEDNNELIKKFAIEDERKYNELEAKRKLLQAECDKQNGILSKMIAESHNNEMVVDRTGKVIKQQIVERDGLIKQWKETVHMLQQCDNDIAKAQEQISITHERVERQREKLEEENVFLQNEQKNVHELDTEIQNLNVFNSRLRKDYNELTQRVLLLNSELHTLKREVAASNLHLENSRIKSKNISHTIQLKEMMYEKYHEDIQKLQLKLKEMGDCTMSSKDRIKRIEMMIDHEEKQYNIFLADTEKLNNVLYRADKLLKEQNVISKTLMASIGNVTCHCNHLRKHIRNETIEVEKVKEVVYNMEYRIGDYERTLCKIERDLKKDDFSDEKEKQIQELEQSLADHKDVYHTLNNQVNRLQEEMHRLTNSIALDKEQLAILQDKCEQHLLVNEISKKRIAAAKQSTQEKQVEENMMRLRIKQIDNDMKKEEKHIYSMEKLRLNLDQAMKERQIEINTNKIILQVKRRSLQEDQGRLRADIVTRRLKIEQIQKKYHIALMTMGKDKDGQPLTITHFKIKNAQEKFFLQQQGDDLDKKIKITEKEIVAMENTLKIVNLTNAAFKNSLSPVEDDDEEAKEMALLEAELKEKSYAHRERKRELEQKKQESEDINNKLAEITSDKNKKRELIENLEDEIRSIQQQELDKADKVKRAETQIKKVLKRLSKIDISYYNRDFEIRQMRDGNRSTLNKLANMCRCSPETAPLINRYMMEHNLPFFDRKASTNSSHSTVSLISSRCSSTNKVTTARSDCSSSSSLQESIVKKMHLEFNP